MSKLRGPLKVSRKSIVSLVYQAWCKSRALISLAFRRELSKNARTSSTHHLRSKVYRRSASNHERPFLRRPGGYLALSAGQLLHTCWPQSQTARHCTADPKLSAKQRLSPSCTRDSSFCAQLPSNRSTFQGLSHKVFDSRVFHGRY